MIYIYTAKCVSSRFRLGDSLRLYAGRMCACQAVIAAQVSSQNAFFTAVSYLTVTLLNGRSPLFLGIHNCFQHISLLFSY